MVRGIDSFRDWFQGYEDQYAMDDVENCFTGQTLF